MKYGWIILTLMFLTATMLSATVAGKSMKKAANESLTKARDLIDQRKFDEAEKHIKASLELISFVKGDHAPKMLKTINDFKRIEKMMASSRMKEADKILKAIAAKECCKLGKDIYPGAIKYYQTVLANNAKKVEKTASM